MKRMRKGIVVLVIAATGAIGVVGASTNAQASAVTKPVPVTATKPEPVITAMGSSWQ